MINDNIENKICPSPSYPKFKRKTKKMKTHREAIGIVRSFVCLSITDVYEDDLWQVLDDFLYDMKIKELL